MSRGRAFDAAAGLVCLLLALVPSLAAAEPVQFREHVIATDLKGGYQVLPLDVNRDGALDLIALTIGTGDLVWYENPGWQRRVMVSGLSRMVNLAACSSDAAGYPEIVLAHEFSSRAKDSLGIVSVLRQQAGPRNPWSVREIDRLATSHRVRCADIDGSGKKVAVNAPTAGHLGKLRFLVSIEPWHGHQVVVYHEGRRVVIDDSLVDGHALATADLNGDGRDEIIAGYRGHGWSVYVYYAQEEDGTTWTRTVLDNGGISASECAVADLNEDGRPDIACIGSATANLKWYENLGE